MEFLRLSSLVKNGFKKLLSIAVNVAVLFHVDPQMSTYDFMKHELTQLKLNVIKSEHNHCSINPIRKVGTA